MILFDSSVVIDARDSDSPFHDWAKRQIAAAVQEGGEGGPLTPLLSARRQCAPRIVTLSLLCLKAWI